MQAIVSEEDFRKRVMGTANANGWHVSWIESHLSAAGIPDLNIFINEWGKRVDVWLELKVVKNGQIKMRPTQKRWHRERSAVGGKSWVLVYDRAAEHILAVPGRSAAVLAPGVEAWRAVAAVEPITNLPGLLVGLSQEVKE